MTSGDSLPSHDAKSKAASRRRNLALFVLGLVTLPSCQAMLLVYGTRIREYYAINAEQFGTLFGSRGLGRIPALLTIGPLLARMGVRRVTELATVGIGIGFLILGVGGTLAAFRVSMPVMGFFLGLSGIAIPAFLISLFPDRKRRIFSVMLVASAAPSILTPLLANELLKWSNERGDAAFATVLQTPFVICGGALLLGGLLLSLAKLKESRAELERPHRIRIGQLLHLRSLAIVLMLSLHAAADTTLYTFLPMFMASQFKHLPLPPATAVARTRPGLRGDPDATVLLARGEVAPGHLVPGGTAGRNHRHPDPLVRTGGLGADSLYPGQHDVCRRVPGAGQRSLLGVHGRIRFHRGRRHAGQ